MIILDASVLIAHLDGADAQHDRATAVLDQYAGEGFRLTSLTLAEVLVRPARAGVLPQVLAAVGRLPVDVAGLDPSAAGPLARLRAETGLRLPDCCVLLEAERTGDGLSTFDDRLAAVAQDRGVRTVR